MGFHLCSIHGDLSLMHFLALVFCPALLFSLSNSNTTVHAHEVKKKVLSVLLSYSLHSVLRGRVSLCTKAVLVATSPSGLVSTSHNTKVPGACATTLSCLCAAPQHGKCSYSSTSLVPNSYSWGKIWSHKLSVCFLYEPHHLRDCVTSERLSLVR